MDNLNKEYCSLFSVLVFLKTFNYFLTQKRKLRYIKTGSYHSFRKQIQLAEAELIIVQVNTTNFL